MADVEVQRVAVDQQEERRHEEQDEQRPPIAADLPQLLARDGQRLPEGGHAALRSATSRNTSSSDGWTMPQDVTVMPCASSRDAIAAGVGVARAKHGVHGGAEDARLLDFRHRVERTHRADGVGVPALRESAAT